MIKLIETAVFKDGRESTTHQKEFNSWSEFKRKIVASPMTTELCYKLMKHREAFIDYEDGRVHLKVVEENHKLKIIGAEDENTRNTAADTTSATDGTTDGGESKPSLILNP